jgi:formylglycine-generating enzyme required for sulfatase activity
MTRREAERFCEAHGGRLPTEDEWIVAAVSAMNPPRRYPWGDTGAVCRRAAWGLKDGPCARGTGGPDTVGAHPDGDSPLGLHDLAGNVAEWVSDDAASAQADAPVLGSGPQDTELSSGAGPQDTELSSGAGPQDTDVSSGPREGKVGKPRDKDLGGGGPKKSDLGFAKGGAWTSTLAAELRVWARLELSPGARDPRVGVRCVYAP